MFSFLIRSIVKFVVSKLVLFVLDENYMRISFILLSDFDWSYDRIISLKSYYLSPPKHRTEESNIEVNSSFPNQIKKKMLRKLISQSIKIKESE